MSGLAVRNRSGGPVGSIACRLLADAGATVLVADAGLDAQVVILGPADELPASGPAVIGHGTTGPLAARATDPESLVAARYGLATAQAGWAPGPVHLRVPYLSVNAAILLVTGVLAAVLPRGRGAAVVLVQGVAQLREELVAPGIADAEGHRAGRPQAQREVEPVGRRVRREENAVHRPRPGGEQPAGSATARGFPAGTDSVVGDGFPSWETTVWSVYAPAMPLRHRSRAGGRAVPLVSAGTAAWCEATAISATESVFGRKPREASCTATRACAPSRSPRPATSPPIPA